MTEPIINISALNKTFKSKDSSYKALDNISLSINKGDIYGLLGFSADGKSTLDDLFLSEILPVCL